jgi:hypothetical protein
MRLGFTAFPWLDDRREAGMSISLDAGLYARGKGAGADVRAVLGWEAFAGAGFGLGARVAIDDLRGSARPQITPVLSLHLPALLVTDAVLLRVEGGPTLSGDSVGWMVAPSLVFRID